MTDLREQAWIAAARKGDQAAFEELVRLYEKRVLALTQRMCKNPEDAAEAAQEAFFAAWQGLKNFRGDSRFSTWLYRLASNACVDLLRREGKRQGAVSLDDEDLNLDIPAAVPSPQEEAERRELREQIEEGVDGIFCQLTPEGIADSIEALLGDEEKRKKLGKAAERKNMAQEQELQKLLELL